MKRLIVAILYIAQAFYTWGTLMAKEDYENSHDFAALNLHSRDSCGIVAMESIFPTGFLIAAGASNFNQHGWELWERP